MRIAAFAGSLSPLLGQLVCAGRDARGVVGGGRRDARTAAISARVKHVGGGLGTGAEVDDARCPLQRIVLVPRIACRSSMTSPIFRWWAMDGCRNGDVKRKSDGGA